MGYKRNSWNAICDVCGFEFKSNQLRERWDGFMVCRDDWETRHPQEFVRAIKESTIPWSRPEATDTEIVVDYIGNGYVVEDYFSPNPDPVEGYYWL